jgi:hypothetical protein
LRLSLALSPLLMTPRGHIKYQAGAYVMLVFSVCASILCTTNALRSITKA